MQNAIINERALLVNSKLTERYPQPKGLLVHTNAWELLVATILAAQCTDARVNLVTPVFFRRWPDPTALAKAKPEEVEEVIHSTGFFRNKAKNLIRAAHCVQIKYYGQVPKTLAELIILPGVARKTANVVLFGAFGINEGLAVDTHVARISRRLGLTDNTNPVRIEQDLLKLFPCESWGNVNHRMVWFGREICLSRVPKCLFCELQFLCPACKFEQTTG